MLRNFCRIGIPVAHVFFPTTKTTRCGARTMTLVDAPCPSPCQIEAAIECRCGWDVLDLQVEFRDGLLVLRGLATTYYAKQLAQQTAMAVTGLSVLVNLIVVTGQPSL
jgi:hypothetical protein